MSSLPRFNIGDLVVPALPDVCQRQGAHRIGVIIEVEHHTIYGPSYGVHFLRANYTTVGWEQHSLQHYTEGVQSAA